MPHLRVLPRPRLCQNLTRKNTLQVLGYVPVEHIPPGVAVADDDDSWPCGAAWARTDDVEEKRQHRGKATL